MTVLITKLVNVRVVVKKEEEDDDSEEENTVNREYRNV